MKKLSLHWKIIIGMFLGVAVGLIFSSINGGNIIITNWVKPFGTIFINSLKLIAIPLILASLIKGISDLKDISKDNKLKAIGLCDTSNLCGALEFAEKLSKSGSQPIIGTQINIKYKDYFGLIPLIAKNYIGYKNIIELSSKSYLENSEIAQKSFAENYVGLPF